MAKIPKRPDEISICKSIMMQIDDDNVLLVVERWHAEKTPQGKQDRSKSFYQWLARPMPLLEVKNYIKEGFADENFTVRWKWPNDKSPFYTFTNRESTYRAAAEFFANKVKKLVSWEYGQKILNGWKTQTEKRLAGFYRNAAYQIKGYIAEDGTSVDLDDKAALLKHLSQNLTHSVTKRSQATVHVDPNVNAASLTKTTF